MTHISSFVSNIFFKAFEATINFNKKNYINILQGKFGEHFVLKLKNEGNIFEGILFSAIL